MLKENELIGPFSLYRQEVRPFTNKQIELDAVMGRAPSGQIVWLVLRKMMKRGSRR